MVVVVAAAAAAAVEQRPHLASQTPGLCLCQSPPGYSCSAISASEPSGAVRCCGAVIVYTSCSVDLALPIMVKSSGRLLEWLSNQRPMVWHDMFHGAMLTSGVTQMISCPSCRKALPRCALCLLTMGCINPVSQVGELCSSCVVHICVCGAAELYDGTAEGSGTDVRERVDMWDPCDYLCRASKGDAVARSTPLPHNNMPFAVRRVTEMFV